MRCIPYVHHVGVPGTVGSAWTRGGVPDKGAVLPVDVRAGALVTAAPTSECDNLVVGIPFRKRVVSRMEDYDAAALPDELEESLLHRGGPGVAVVVEDHETVLPEIHGEARHVGPRLR